MPSAIEFTTIHILTVLLAASVVFSSEFPLLVVPSCLRWNATNELIITPIGTTNNLVDIRVDIRGEEQRDVVYLQTLQARVAGATVPVKFNLPERSAASKKYLIKIKVQNEEPFETSVGGCPDVRNIYVQTDKAIYRPAETVKIRALPITAAGHLYYGPIELIIMNPNGFQLMTKNYEVSDRFISAEFVLPTHLNFGEWKILAKPTDDHSQNVFSTSFSVQDYALPPFRVFLSTSETDDPDVHTVTVVTKSPQGSPLAGSVAIRCKSLKRIQNAPSQATSIELAQSEVENGQWSQNISLERCERFDKGIIVLSADVRDYGSGNRVETEVDVDVQLAGFEMIPLRPGFTKSSSAILILVKRTDGRVLKNGKNILIEATHICTDRTKTNNKTLISAELDSTVSIPLDIDYVCLAVRVQGKRKVGARYSRQITLMVPSFRYSAAVNFSWITFSPPVMSIFNVGDKFSANLPVELSESLNFLVVCNGRTITTAGRVRDDGKINFEVTPDMVSQCVLYVFKFHGDLQTDMLLFFVENNCSYSLNVSQTSIEPGENLIVTLNGKRNGLATVRAVDKRMFALLQTLYSAPHTKFWDLSFFNRPELKEDQARLLNFLDAKQLIEEFSDSCREAGSLLLKHIKRCPELEEASSIVSELCLQEMIDSCDRITKPTSSTVCDRNSGRPCHEADFVFAGILPITKMKAPAALDMSPKQREQSRDVMRKAREKQNEKTKHQRIREFFPEVWLFGDYKLGYDGKKEITLLAPDSVTQWSISSSFWAPGDLAVCSPNSVTVTSNKKFFISAQLPKHVYVNETITALISVSAENIEQEQKYSICLSGLERRVCGDIGADGERGELAYSRIQLSPSRKTVAKTFSLKFLSIGESEATFTLKEENSRPGIYHCDEGVIYDKIKVKVTIAKRAETEEHFKRIILNPEKPVNTPSVPENSKEHILYEGARGQPQRDTIDYVEERSSTNPHQLHTHVHINIPDTEAVYSLTVELSKFLPTDPVAETTRNSVDGSPVREKRGAYMRRFLSDPLSSFAAALYDFKSLRLHSNNLDFEKMEQLETKIGSLMSEILTFSDCRGEGSCGFSEYKKPESKEERSILLSSIATSLFCEATADERIVCPAMGYIIETLNSSSLNLDDPILSQLGFSTSEDRIWFMRALIARVGSDCGVYHCSRSDRLWLKLWESFLYLRQQQPLDIRTTAALAYMAEGFTRDLQRHSMNKCIREKRLPYWTLGRVVDGHFTEELHSKYSNLLGFQAEKGGEILVNSLGVLAFVTSHAFNDIQFDSLADWIHEQLNTDGTVPSFLDSYFANRALYEYRRRKVGANDGGAQLVTISCNGCHSIVHNVSDVATLFYMPVQTRVITLTTEGRSKVRAGIRLLATKRQRQRRELGQEPFYPVTITIVQRSLNTGTLQHEVCLSFETPMIESLEITHGLFTGFSSDHNLFRLYDNTTLLGVKLANKVGISTYAAHFVLIGLKPNVKQCYELGSTEPTFRYEPYELAPIAITARHFSYDVVGQLVVFHIDRQLRKKRSIAGSTVDTVCWDGQCACAEATCTVRCLHCRSITKARLNTELCLKNTFGASVEITSISERTVDGIKYTVMDVDVKHWRLMNYDTYVKPESIEVWLRECNIRCTKPKVGETFYLSGNAVGLTTDLYAKTHYILRENDRWEKATEDCGLLFSHLITLSTCA